MSQPGQRAVDLLLIAQYTFLVLLGYFYCYNASRYAFFYPCLLPPLMLASFVGVFYPFRVFTRAIWLVLAPLSVWFSILFGIILFVRLNTAPAFRSTYYTQSYVSYTVPATVFIYLLPLLVWLAVFQFGWRLQKVGQRITSRAIQLKELLALTGVVGAATVLAQSSLQPEQVAMGKGLFVEHYHTLMVWAAIESAFLTPIVLASFSRSHLLSIVACLLYITISFAADSMHRWDDTGDFKAFLNINQAWPLSYIVLPYRGERIAGSITLAILIFASRWCGFRLVRDAGESKNAGADVDSGNESSVSQADC